MKRGIEPFQKNNDLTFQISYTFVYLHYINHTVRVEFTLCHGELGGWVNIPQSNGNCG